MDRLRALWDFDDLSATEARLRYQLLSEPDDGRAEVFTQLARIEGLRDQFGEAEHLLIAAEKLASSDVARARIDLERGRVLRASGDPEAALPLFETAYARARASGHDYIAADAVHMAAIVDHAWAARGIAFAESSEDARYWLGPIWNNLGWSRLDAGDAAAALDAFEHALAACDLPRERAIARYAIACALRELGRLPEAIEELEVALAQSPGPHPIIEDELAALRLAVSGSS